MRYNIAIKNITSMLMRCFYRYIPSFFIIRIFPSILIKGLIIGIIFDAHWIVAKNHPPALTPQALVNAAAAQIGKTILYDPCYRKISFPLGDVPMKTGVCSDVIIRAFRVFGIDLQKNVAESIALNPALYKKHLTKGRRDTNIDHRRVKILSIYFKKKGWEKKTRAYTAGDILVFDLGHGQWHIALVSSRRSADKKRLLIIHNIGMGVQEEDAINAFTLLHHFRPGFRPYKPTLQPAL
jgi:uncharacterized protein YijF (DUF1287 family)